jgi:hypothetical protein
MPISFNSELYGRPPQQFLGLHPLINMDKLLESLVQACLFIITAGLLI